MPNVCVSNFSNISLLLQTPAVDDFCRTPSLPDGADAADDFASSDEDVDPASDVLDADEEADVSTSVEPAEDWASAMCASPPLATASSLSELPSARDGD